MKEIKEEFMREIQTKINCQKNILEIIKEVLNIENDLPEEIKKLIQDNLDLTNYLEFYQKLIYSNSLGEYYTPKSIVELINNLTSHHDNSKLVYEPTVGLGTLVSRFENVHGQELNHESAMLLKMLNNKYKIEIGDTLSDDKFSDNKYDLVISNPPYGGSGWDPFEDEKFKPCPVGKKAIEMAFVQHIIDKMSDKGEAYIVLPHGVLFRSGKEGKVRKWIIENNLIDTIIGLPANLFSNTQIPTIILVLKKCKSDNKVLFIDASKEFEKIKTQNTLNEDHISKIVETYKKREEIEKFSHLASIEDIEENDFNLNIPRYVDTFEEEEPIDIVQVSKEYKELVEEEKKIRSSILEQMEELNGDEDILKALREMIEVF